MLVTFTERIYAPIVHTNGFRRTYICVHSTQRIEYAST